MSKNSKISSNLLLVKKLIFNFTALLFTSLFLLSCGLFYYDKDSRDNLSYDSQQSSKSGASQDGFENMHENSGNAEKSTSGNGNNTNNDESNGNDAGTESNTALENNGEENNNGADSSGLKETAIFKVIEVIDGDTLRIENSENIRLIGINTPETGMFFYEEAKEVLRIIAEDRYIQIEKDVTDRDRYGRLLRYVYCGNLFINLEMVQRGFANVFTMPPDVKYQDVLLDGERFARKNNLGLWARSPYSFKTEGNGSKEAAILIYINWDAKGDDKQNMNDEYAVLINDTETDIDIGGWTVKDSGTNIYEFKSYNFNKGSRIILYTGQGSDGNGKFYWNSDMPVWNNSGDIFYLRDKEGLLVEIFDY